MSADREATLQGRWVHSHEEDTEHETVFRPATHPLPPSRGRSSLELHADGTYVRRSPGPVDVPVESRGSWSLDGDRLVLSADGAGPDEVWQIAALDGERLVIRR